MKTLIVFLLATAYAGEDAATPVANESAEKPAEAKADPAPAGETKAEGEADASKPDAPEGAAEGEAAPEGEAGADGEAAEPAEPVLKDPVGPCDGLEDKALRACQREHLGIVPIELTGVGPMDDIFKPARDLQLSLAEARNGLIGAQTAIREAIGAEEGEELKPKLRKFAEEAQIRVVVEKETHGEHTVMVSKIETEVDTPEVRQAVHAIESASKETASAIKACSTIPKALAATLPRLAKVPLTMGGAMKKAGLDKTARGQTGSLIKQNVKSTTGLPKLAVQTVSEATQLMTMIARLSEPEEDNPDAEWDDGD